MTDDPTEMDGRAADGPRMLTPSQVAERLSCSKDLVLDLIHAGALPAVCISKSVRSRKPVFRVCFDDVDRFVEGRMVRRPARRIVRRPPYERIV